MTSRTPIGGLLLDAPGWSFSVRGGTIAGRLGDLPGVLRVATRAPNQISQPPAHEQCLRIAAEWLDAGDDAKFHDRQLMESVTGPYGTASFRKGNDDVTLWYCCRPAGLILGAYACPAAAGRSPEAGVMRSRCGRMIASALFDRSAWGAEDELTKFVIAELAAGDPPAARPPAAPPPPPADPDTPRKAPAPLNRRKP